MITSLSNLTSYGLDATLALVYPQPCAICAASVESRHDGVVCDSCWNSTPLFGPDDVLCWKCGALSRAHLSKDHLTTVVCGRCDDEAFTAARACGLYEGALRASVLELKRQPHVSRRLLDLLCGVQGREPLNSSDLIVPVPLHPARERERGFNQAIAMARALARVSGIPIDEHSLVRGLHTERHRGGMDARARRESVASAFAVRHADLIAGKRVLLVDDVFTTGATVSACAVAVRDAGAEEVFVLTIARAR